MRTASDILGRDADLSYPAIPIEEREGIEIGHRRNIFAGSAFEVLQEVIEPSAASEFGHHPTQDRFIWLLNGALFVIGEDKGKPFQRPLAPGQFWYAPAGISHGYATSGDADAVVLIVQGRDYAAGFKQERPAAATDLQPASAATPPPGPEATYPPEVLDRAARMPQQGSRIVTPSQVAPPSVAALTRPLDAPAPQPMRVSADVLSEL